MNRQHPRLAASLIALAAAIAGAAARAEQTPPPFSVGMIPGGAVTNAMLQHPSATLGSTTLTLGGTATALNGLNNLGVGTASATAPAEVHANNPFTAGGIQPTLLVGRRPDASRASLGVGYDQTHSWNFDVTSAGQLEFYAYNGSFTRQAYISQTGAAGFAGTLTAGDHLQGTNSASPALVYVGTSITLGTGGTHPYTYYVTPPTFGGLSFTASNIGINAELLTTMLADVPSNLNPLFASNAGVNIAVIQGGDNDMANGASAGQAFSYLQRLSQHLRDMGWQTIVTTNISRTGQDSNKNSYNALIRAGWSQFADGLADIGADSRLGADNAYSNTTYFNVDGIHPNDTGYPIYAGIVQTALTNLVNAGKAAPAIATLAPEQTSGFSWTGLSANNYRLTCQNLVPSSSGASILLQFGEGTVDSVSWVTSGYEWGLHYDGTSATTGALGSTSDTGIKLGNNLKTSNGSLILLETTVAGLTKMIQHGALSNAFAASASSDAYFHFTSGGTYPGDTTAKTALRLVASTGSISSGNCRLRQENS